LEIILFSMFHLGSWHCALVSGHPWGKVYYWEVSLMSHRTIPDHTYHFSHFILFHFLIFWDFRVYWPKKGLYLISWEEGTEGLEGMCLEKFKIQNNKPSIWSSKEVLITMKHFSKKIKDLQETISYYIDVPLVEGSTQVRYNLFFTPMALCVPLPSSEIVVPPPKSYVTHLFGVPNCFGL